MNDEEIDECAVRVCVRVRPMSEMEYARGDTPNAVVLGDDRTVRVKVETEGRRKIETHHYQFDKAFDPSTSQLDVFQESGTEAFCDIAFRGAVATVFCFGQTGSGKTYTMSGPVADGEVCVATGLAADPNSMPLLGLQYRAAHYISRQAANMMNTEGLDVTLKASFVEIYNESVNDLLQEKDNLKVRWAQSAQTFFIENLMIVRCDNLDDLLAVLEEGNTNRKRASHRLNIDSSRSHVMFTVYIEVKARGSRAPPKLGKINFVDLAGSERLKDSGSSGINAQETKSINKSLFALGNVIQSLASRKESAFIPYRDSTLTKLLMDSLGGACKTLMIACITPSTVYTEETVSTLKYATRTSNIINQKAKVRTDPQEQLIYDLRTEIEMLKEENAALKAKLNARGGGGELPQLAPTPTDERRPNIPLAGGGGGGGGGGGYAARMMARHSPSPMSMDPGALSQTPPNPAPPPAQQRWPPARGFDSQPMQVDALPPAQKPSLQPLTTTPTPPPIYTPQQQATMDIAEKVQRDNERLREEVAQLRNLVLSSRASSPMKSQQQSSATFTNTLSSQLDPPSTAGDGRSLDSGFGFRALPKRAARLSLMPISEANNTQMTNFSSVSAPVMPTTDPGREFAQPTSRSAISAASPSPNLRDARYGLGGNGETDFQSMRRQLEQAEREMLLARLQGKSNNSAYPSFF
jgi:hypothetical protein